MFGALAGWRGLTVSQRECCSTRAAFRSCLSSVEELACLERFRSTDKVFSSSRFFLFFFLATLKATIWSKHWIQFHFWRLEAYRTHKIFNYIGPRYCESWFIFSSTVFSIHCLAPIVYKYMYIFSSSTRLVFLIFESFEPYSDGLVRLLGVWSYTNAKAMRINTEQINTPIYAGSVVHQSTQQRARPF